MRYIGYPLDSLGRRPAPLCGRGALARAVLGDRPTSQTHRAWRYIALALLFAAGLPAADDGWSAYGRDPGGTRYSPLKQITRANVAKLKVAWTYHTGALQPETRLNQKAAFEATPILVNGALYLSTPYNQVIALDPATGAEKWKFDPQISRTHGYSEVTSRGVAAWTDGRGAEDAPCHLRIFEGTIDARLLAVDGRTGKLCADFGDAGQVDLTQGVDYQKIYRGNYEVTSAPTVVGDVVITGSSIGDNVAVNLERGVVRGYDTVSYTHLDVYKRQGFMRGPGRREIGHGALAERSLLPIIPPEAVFPYTCLLYTSRCV